VNGAGRRAGAFATALVGLAVLLALAAWLALPAWIEARLVPDLAQRYGIGPVALDIRRIGARGLDVADICIGQALTADHLTADYRPAGLLRRRIERIVVSGLTVRAAWDNGLIRVKGIDLPAFGGRAADRGAGLPDAWIGRLEIHGGLLQLAWGAAQLTIPFSLVATCPAPDLSCVNARLEIFPRRRPVRVMLQADARQNVLSAVVQADNTPLDRADILPAPEKLRLGGRVSARAEFRAALFPFHIRSLAGEATWTDLRLEAPGARLIAAPGPQPLRLSWRLPESASRLAFDVSGALRLVHPVAAEIEALHGNGALDSGLLEIEAGASLRLGPPWNGFLDISQLKGSARLNAGSGPEGRLTVSAGGSIGGPLPMNLESLRLEVSGRSGDIKATGEFSAATGESLAVGSSCLAPTGMRGTFSARLQNRSAWRAALDAAATAPNLELTAGGQTVHLARPQIHLDLSGENGALAVAGRWAAARGRMTQAGVDITWPKIEGKVHGTLDWPDPLAGGELRFAVGLPQVTAANDQVAAELRRARLAGRIQLGRPPTVEAELRAAGRIHWPDGDLTAEPVALRLPLQWPATKPAAGSLAMKLTPRPGLNPGRLEATLRQTGHGLVVDGVLQDLFFTGTRVQLTAAAEPTPSGIRGRLEADLAPWSPAAPIELGGLAPAAGGLTVDGKLALHADLTLEAGRLQSQARIRFTEGTLADGTRQRRAAGIEADLQLVDLPTLRSAPGQVLRLAGAELGNIRIGEGAVVFQVEAPHQVLLEKGSFAWCGGRVHLEAMRFSPAVDDYRLTLFCDRLKLAELLDQIGGLSAEGGGTVSGRIPLHYRRGRLAFNDGFLFSSPGEGGKIRLAGLERFTAAIDPQTLEATQLALASEALKDYEYQWVKVGIDSKNEMLALRLQFDGKPSGPLPFVYRQELGRFVRMEDSHPGSRFQGIGLDINLRLPLNRILEYGDLMKRLESARPAQPDQEETTAWEAE